MVTPVPAVGERIGSVRLHGIGCPGSRSSRSTIMNEPFSCLIKGKTFVVMDNMLPKASVRSFEHCKMKMY
ncbi:hypothetical protein AALP_AAs39584U000300 [Arabis alpina]|uniref:Uncharacterized protein n=1 Tax=Arabis alpina TaxID=50452 RepID=A0A087FX00_ARAAL|nr:hypothetical protein AALP_AAs39584U000300 [Arabis alpina]